MSFVALLATMFVFLTPLANASGRIYVPENFSPAQAELVVVLHGCNQSPADIERGTGFNKIAEERGWVIMYPEIPMYTKLTNPLGCWNWFQSSNQNPDTGELKYLIELIREIRKDHNLQGQTYLAGMSSGGITVSGLIACYPNEFAAAAIHSGMAYGLASNWMEAVRIMRQEPKQSVGADHLDCRMSDFKGRLLVIHGAQDEVVHPAHAEFIKTQVLGGSCSSKLVDESRVKVVMVDGVGHAWSGAEPTRLDYFSPYGPSATRMMSDFWKP